MVHTEQQRPSSDQPREVVFLVRPEFDLLALTGPWEVFYLAALSGNDPAYRLTLLSATQERDMRSFAGITLATHQLARHWRKEIDMLIVPAFAEIMHHDTLDPRWCATIRRLASRARRVAAVWGRVCSGRRGTAAGLLQGQRATTHWTQCERLARLYSDARVEPDAIFVRDGPICTSAGVTAGMDLALALVEEDLGRRTALEVARHLVMFVRRPGGQSQFSYALEAQRAEREPRFVERLRVEAARLRLEQPSAALEHIAQECGFAGVNAMRRSFLRVLHVTPSAYRERFQSTE
jgi:transcriptional regulator GlxA family with amidase domain